MKAIGKMNDVEREKHLKSMTTKYQAYNMTFVDVDTSQKSHIRYTYTINGNQYINTENEITWMLGIWKNKRKSFEQSKDEVYGYWRKNPDLMQIAIEKGIITADMVKEGKIQTTKQVNAEKSIGGNIQTLHTDKTPKYDFDPEFIPEKESLNEGAVMQVLVNRYERNHVAREKCIKAKGCRCAVCGMDFNETYGKIGEGFIHIHHTVPISSIKENYTIDYANDLVPVCPNCHAMMHKKNPPYTVDEMKEILTNQK